MSSYKEFLKNIFIFGVSSFGSKAITIILLPLYSYNLTISEYGQLDVLLTFIMLFIPFVSLSLHESILKFCIDGSFGKNKIISSAFGTFFIFFVLLSIIAFFILYFFVKNNYAILFLLILFTTSIYEYVSKYSNGVGKQLVYAVSNIIISLALLILNILLVYFFNLGINGVLLSHLISYGVGIIFIYIKLNLKNEISTRYYDFDLTKKMLTISIPLIPNAAMWWIFNVSDRVILFNINGAEEAGLYGVANKLATLISLINAIVFQAWQISALRQKSSKNRDVFYSNIINTYILFMYFCASFLILINRDILGFTLSDEYSQAWKIGNFLIFSTIFYCAASFIGVFYVIFDNTKRAFKTSLYAAIINIVFNFLLIPLLGAYGAAISTIISTVFIFLFRIYDTSKLVNYSLDRFVFFGGFIFLGFQVFLSSLNDYIFSSITNCVYLFLFLYRIKNLKEI